MEAQRASSADGKKRSFLTVGWSGMLEGLVPHDITVEPGFAIQSFNLLNCPLSLSREVGDKLSVMKLNDSDKAGPPSNVTGLHF